MTPTVSRSALVYSRITANHRKIVLLVILAIVSLVPFVYGVSAGFANGFVYFFGSHASTRKLGNEVRAEGIRDKELIEEEVERRARLAEQKFQASNESLQSTVMVTAAAGLSIVVLLLFGSVTRACTAKLLHTAGARPANSTTAEERVRGLLATMAERAGIPEPRLYIIDSPVPNAFSTGMRPVHSSVVVTEGLIKLLNDSEMEGVLAHEMSHIGNHDTRLDTAVAAIALFLRLPYLLRRRHLEQKRLREQFSLAKRGGNALRIALSPLYLYLFSVAPLLAAAIRAAISRRREYLADVDAVVLTREAEGLMRALAKIGGAGSSENSANQLLSHAYFADPMPRSTSVQRLQARVLGTHPPIAQRIERLMELNGETPLSIIEKAVNEGKDFGREHPPLEVLDPATTIGTDELSALTVGSPTGRVFRMLGPTPVFEAANKSSHVLARIPAGGFLVVFDDPGSFRSVLTQDEVFGYIPAAAKMLRVDMLPAEIHNPAARQRAVERMAMAATGADVSPGELTQKHIGIAVGFTLLLIAAMVLALMQFGGK